MTFQVGDRVRFPDSGTTRVGQVTEILTVGRTAGVGVWRPRQRAAIRYLVNNRPYVTLRDLDEIVIDDEGQQGSLLDEERQDRTADLP